MVFYNVYFTLTKYSDKEVDQEDVEIAKELQDGNKPVRGTESQDS